MSSVDETSEAFEETNTIECSRRIAKNKVTNNSESKFDKTRAADQPASKC